MPDNLSFGIPALDKAIMDGIPKGYTILCIGPPGAGIELFAKRFASAGADSEDVRYFSTSEGDDDIIKTMKGFGWLFRAKSVTINPRPRPFVQFTNDDRKAVAEIFKREMLRR